MRHLNMQAPRWKMQGMAITKVHVNIALKLVKKSPFVRILERRDGTTPPTPSSPPWTAAPESPLQAGRVLMRSAAQPADQQPSQLLEPWA